MQEKQAEALSITVSGGNPSDEELGAVLAVLQAVTSAPVVASATDDRPLAGGWKSYHRTLRRTMNPGREAWRASARP